MAQEYDWDIYDIFKEQLDLQLPQIESHILSLDKRESIEDNIDDLFRAFHNYKATSKYLSLTPFSELVIKVENVLSSLREDSSVLQDSIVDWLFQVKDQLEVWSKQMDTRETELSDFSNDLIDKIKVSKSYSNPNNKLKTLNAIYVDANVERAKKVIPFLKKLTKDVKYSRDINSSKSILEKEKYDILITNIDKDSFELKDFINESFPDTHIVAIFNKISDAYSKKLIKAGITYTIENPLNAQKIQRELISLTKTYFSSRHIIIDHKKIYNFIQTLQPLPNTIFQIAQICDDDELHVKDLIKVVKNDPIIAANILNAANSPMYGSTEIKTIDQAITRLGKRAVKAISMCDTYKNLGEINLVPYNIDEDTFSKISKTRLSLMLKWYSKISIADLSTLSTTALLGNIGQILISKEIMNMKKEDEFKNISKKFDTQYAEESLVHTTTSQISAQILNYWNLSKDIVDVISYSDNPVESSQELKKLTVANHIIYKLVKLDGTILSEIPDELLQLMADNDFDPNLLQKALNFILENS